MCLLCFSFRIACVCRVKKRYQRRAGVVQMKAIWSYLEIRLAVRYIFSAAGLNLATHEEDPDGQKISRREGYTVVKRSSCRRGLWFVCLKTKSQIVEHKRSGMDRYICICIAIITCDGAYKTNPRRGRGQASLLLPPAVYRDTTPRWPNCKDWKLKGSRPDLAGLFAWKRCYTVEHKQSGMYVNGIILSVLLCCHAAVWWWGQNS